MDTQSGRISHVNYMWRDRGEQGVIWVQPQFLELLAAPPHSRRSLKLELCEILGTSGTSREELEEWKQGGISRLVWWSGVTRGLFLGLHAGGKKGEGRQAEFCTFIQFPQFSRSHNVAQLVASRMQWACWNSMKDCTAWIYWPTWMECISYHNLLRNLIWIGLCKGTSLLQKAVPFI